MIFITLGSQKFQFNRLLKAVDEQIADGRIEDDVFAQIGASNYKPRYFKYDNYLDRDVFARLQQESEIVITHGGTGAIVGALKKGKKVIAIPRLMKFGEHVDDHQLQLVHEFDELNLICACQNCEEIWKAIKVVKKTNYKNYESNTNKYVKSIEDFIEQ